MMWPYAASALTSMRLRLPRMREYYGRAVEIADAIRGLPGLEILPNPVVSPMMHIRLSVGLDDFRERVGEIARSDKIWTFSRPYVSEGPTLQRFELHVGDATLELSVDEIRQLFERLLGVPRA
jgi:hypothetical protein